MSGKSLDEAMSPSELSAYERGVADTHARYESQQAAAAEWLSRVISVVARIETHEPRHSYARRVLARELREALGLPPTLKLACECERCGRQAEGRAAVERIAEGLAPLGFEQKS